MDYRTVRVAPKLPGGPEGGVPRFEDILTAEEVRVLGCLMEKEATTPDYYPMTLNGLTAACNQKSSRDPVVDYTDGDVQEALDSLKDKGLVRRITSADGRVPRFRHVFPEVAAVDRPQAAALCVLMLRGPQTTGEIRQRTGRIYPFESLAEVEQTLEDLAGRATRPLVVQLERQPGTKEPRYAHLLAGEPDLPAAAPVSAATPRSERIEALEAEVASLKEEVENLKAEFERFRSQF